MRKDNIHTAIIGLGSNINPRQNIIKAKTRLAKDCKILAESRFVTTKPIGKKNQADFLNGAILLETNQSKDKLRVYLKNIEVSLGRKRTNKNFGPRTIDLDILAWNNKVVSRDFYERDFVRDSVLELMRLTL